MSSERALMQEVWRIAGQKPEGVTVPSATPASAARLRFALYNAVKMFRDGRGDPDAALRRAIENCSIRVVGSDVVIQSKLENESAKAMLAIVGGVVKSVEDRALEDSANRVAEMLAQLGPKEEEPEIKPINNYGARNHAPRLG